MPTGEELNIEAQICIKKMCKTYLPLTCYYKKKKKKKENCGMSAAFTRSISPP